MGQAAQPSPKPKTGRVVNAVRMMPGMPPAPETTKIQYNPSRWSGAATIRGSSRTSQLNRPRKLYHSSSWRNAKGRAGKHIPGRGARRWTSPGQSSSTGRTEVAGPSPPAGSGWFSFCGTWNVSSRAGAAALGGPLPSVHLQCTRENPSLQANRDSRLFSPDKWSKMDSPAALQGFSAKRNFVQNHQSHAKTGSHPSKPSAPERQCRLNTLKAPF